MSLLNRKAIKTYIKDKADKQISAEYFQLLERKVAGLIDVSIQNAKSFKRIQIGDLENGGTR
jgi:hypothetical protein